MPVVSSAGIKYNLFGGIKMKDCLNVWSPVKCEKKSDGFSLDVWGRSYDFDKSPLPTKIITQGQNLLYAPIKLVPVFGEASEEWKDFSSLFYSEDEEKAIFITSQTAGNIILNFQYESMK